MTILNMRKLFEKYVFEDQLKLHQINWKLTISYGYMKM